MELAQYALLPQFLLAPEALYPGEAVGAAVVLIRVEDRLKMASPTLAPDESRRILESYVEEIVAQLRVASAWGIPLFAMCCPSRGHVATKRKLASLTTALTATADARIRELPGVRSLAWADVEKRLPPSSTIDDVGADKWGQVPFSEECFDELGRFLGEQIALSSENATMPPTAIHDASRVFDDYLRALDVKVDVVIAGPELRSSVDRLHIVVSAFNTMGVSKLTQDDPLGEGLRNGRIQPWLVHVRDSVGDYGASGVVLSSTSERTFHVESFVLGCPVLGKRVEGAVLAALADVAREAGCDQLAVHFRRTDRNELAQRFVDRLSRDTSTSSSNVVILPLDAIAGALR